MSAPTFTLPEMPRAKTRKPPLEYLAYFEFRKFVPPAPDVIEPPRTALAVRVGIVEHTLSRMNIHYNVADGTAKSGNWKTYEYPDAESLDKSLETWTASIAKRGLVLVTETPVMVPLQATDMRAVRDGYMPRWAADWASKVVQAADDAHREAFIRAAVGAGPTPPSAPPIGTGPSVGTAPVYGSVSEALTDWDES